MNAYQKRLAALVAVNVVLVLLFPPFDSVGVGLGRNASTFDAFYFVFDRQYNKTVNIGLLLLELGWIAANATLAWLLLRTPAPDTRPVSARSGVLIGAGLNLTLMLLLPPFENYASVLRISGAYFDGFYLVFGDKWQRHYFVPLLYLEVFWLLINAATLWLLFRPTTEATGPA